MKNAEYIRDLHSNYLVLKGLEETLGYKVKILLNNTIKGIIKAELRCIDQIDFYYYDITGKKTLTTIYDKCSINYFQLKFLLESVLLIVERGTEYLLSQDDFIIEPECIFYDEDKNVYGLCMLPGYKVNLQEQLSGLIEYLMNKVDYKDEQAVILLYTLYKEVKEPNCTYDKLMNKLCDKKKNIEKHEDLNWKKPQNNKNLEEKTESNSFGYKLFPDKNIKESNVIEREMTNGVNGLKKVNNTLKDIIKSLRYNKKNNGCQSKIYIKKELNNPLLEEVEKQKEVYYYNSLTFLCAGLSILLGIIAIALAMYFKLLHNSFGNRLDTIKVTCFILLLGLAETFIMTRLFNKDNRNIKTVTSIEYVECEQLEGFNSEVVNYNQEPNVTLSEELDDITHILYMQEDDEDKTEILCNIRTKQIVYKLYDLLNRVEVVVNCFPFIIGKRMDSVNLIIEDASISRFHAKITIEDKVVYITDLGSTNGTYINGTKLLKDNPCPILPEDEVSFSNIKYIWKMEQS